MKSHSNGMVQLTNAFAPTEELSISTLRWDTMLIYSAVLRCDVAYHHISFILDATVTSPIYLNFLQQSVIPNIRENFK